MRSKLIAKEQRTSQAKVDMIIPQSPKSWDLCDSDALFRKPKLSLSRLRSKRKTKLEVFKKVSKKKTGRKKK